MKITQPIPSGKTVYLRPLDVKDVTDAYVRWMNDPDVIRSMASRGKSYSRAELESYVATRSADPNTLFLAIVLKSTDQHIGNIKVGPIDWQESVGDVGIMIGEKSCWGKGYGTEAIGLLADYALHVLGIRRLTAGYFSGNQGSLNAFLKNDFKIDRTSSEVYPHDSTPVQVTWLSRQSSATEGSARR